jgi:type II secretory pathway pseudopilin PulG
MRTPRRRPGFGVVEVVVVLVLVVGLILLVLMALPRQREVSRAAFCRRNLMQIGMALQVYAGGSGRFPAVPDPSEPEASRGPAPLQSLLLELGQADLSKMIDPKAPPPRDPKAPTDPRLIQGFVCPADPETASGRFPAPVSYRATAGSTPDGRDGPFAPGRLVRPADVEDGDGLSYTVGFAERLVGTGRDRLPDPRHYALVPGPISDACPAAPEASWHGDAGSSWAEAGWRSTLYNHSLTPGTAASCLADDGRTARIGASSGHGGRVHALVLDGSVRTFLNTVDPKVWRAWANINDSSASRP